MWRSNLVNAVSLLFSAVAAFSVNESVTSYTVLYYYTYNNRLFVN